MLTTAFTKLVGATAPIQLAGMPGVSTPELVAAVASAGGLGMLGAPMLSPPVLTATLEQIRTSTNGAFGVNFLMPFLDPACVPVAAHHACVVEFFYGDPDPTLVKQVHAGGALASWQVGSVAEALAAERAGCDLVVAQGTEAGGHVRGQTSLLPLLSAVVGTVRVPVIAAGGIATAGDLAAVLACGAAGARMGTRFVAAAESGAHPSYVRALLAASAADTVLTEAFSDMWPNAPHRVLRSAVAAAEALADDDVGSVRLGDRILPIRRFSVIAPTTTTTGRIDAMALYAGESVGAVTAVQPAAAIVAEVVAGAERRLRQPGF
jgi:NAD(P)H-dependent flavin oxidoreductase YrpB (nitropropane dioxygenase family)